MALRTNRGRPGEVSLTECPFPECGEDIADNESFARHWEDCSANPANGGEMLSQREWEARQPEGEVAD